MAAMSWPLHDKEHVRIALARMRVARDAPVEKIVAAAIEHGIVPPTWTAGQIITASNMNFWIRRGSEDAVAEAVRLSWEMFPVRAWARPRAGGEWIKLPL